MKATEAKLLAFLKGPKQFVIPIYQRTYSWSQKQCTQLWDDIVAVAKDSKRAGHFVGSIVYVERGLHNQVEVPQLLVIDGQQRLTTLTLLLTALRNSMTEAEGTEISARKITNYYLVNAEEDGERRHKLVLTQSDKETLVSLVEHAPLPDESSRRVTDNYRYFEEQIRKAEVTPEMLYQGISKLLVVDISLDREHDNPQLIFESLNSTGLALSQADLIRNYILMGLEPSVQTKLYKQYWFPMEQRFSDAEDTAPFDRFMRDYLTVKTGTIPNIRDVYESFKTFAHSEEAGDVQHLVADIAAFAGYFAHMAFGAEPDALLRARFADINALKVDVAYPLLLELYQDYAGHRFTRDEFAEMLLLIESYVFRRAISGIPTNSLNKTFSEFSAGLKKDRYLESFKARLLLLDSYRRFPRDEEFTRDLQARDVYNLTTRRHYLLRKLENQGRKEPVDVESFTIEHVLPQNPDLSREWQEMLGSDWQRVQQTYLHTIGNLTLTGYNPELSDRPFLKKRDMEGGFRDSPLRLNRVLGKLERWTEDEIKARAEQLAKLASTVWPEPVLEPNILYQFRPAKAGADNGGYSLSDHQYLVGEVRDLFELFRARVDALGTDVTMHVLKLYIAFKTTTNFVDVVPQSSRLRLSLNMAFADLEDPRGLADDVTGLGRWGNGDVQIGLSAQDQLDYVMMLVKQSYDQHRAMPQPAAGSEF